MCPRQIVKTSDKQVWERDPRQCADNMASSPTKVSSSTSSPSKSSTTTTQEPSHSSQTTGGGAGFQDSSEDFLDNPTRDTLAEGLNGLLAPSIEHLDAGIANARGAQLELQDQISKLESQLATINSELQCPVDLEAYVSKLNNAKKRVIVVNNILQGSQVILKILQLIFTRLKAFCSITGSVE